MFRRSLSYTGFVLVLLAVAWGAWRTTMEGFILAWPRGFGGDFTAAMFGGDWWNGRGIIYGPIFVIESWLVAWLPHVFTPHFFALANVFLAVGAFVFCIKACRAGLEVTLVGMALWLCYWRLLYSFAVAANPEFLELFFLSWAWFAASRRRESTEGVLIAAAGLTKLIPWVFVVPLVLRRSVRALTLLVCVTLSVILVVAIGQQMSLSETIFQVIVPFNGRPMTTLAPVAYSSEFVGLLEALARVIFGAGAQPISPEHLLSIRALFVSIVVFAMCVTVWASIRLLRQRSADGEESRWALLYAMYFALVPVLSVQAHAHTFLFLLPIWIAFVDQLWKDKSDVKVRAVFGVCLAFCYVVTGFNPVLIAADKIFRWSLMSTWMRHEPMVGNLLLIVVVWAYIVVRSRVPATPDSVSRKRVCLAQPA